MLSENLTQICWPFLAYFQEYITGNRVIVYGVDVKAENAIVIMNHQFWCDWMTGFVIAYRVRMVGLIKLFVKAIIRYFPGVGTGLFASGCVFLSRNWKKDINKIKRQFSVLANDNRPFWLFSHPEGRRINKKNLEESHNFSKERNLPIMNNVLIPRVKGFSTSILELRHTAQVVYDLTVGYSEKSTLYSSVLGGKPYSVHVHVRRFEMSSLPKTEEEINTWLYDRYAEKDKLLDYFKKHGEFEDKRVTTPPTDYTRLIYVVFPLWLLSNVFIISLYYCGIKMLFRF